MNTKIHVLVFASKAERNRNYMNKNDISSLFKKNNKQHKCFKVVSKKSKPQS